MVQQGSVHSVYYTATPSTNPLHVTNICKKIVWLPFLMRHDKKSDLLQKLAKKKGSGTTTFHKWDLV